MTDRLSNGLASISTWEVYDAHKTLANLPRYHSQGPALRCLLESGLEIPVDHEPYIVVTAFLPGFAGLRHSVTVTPAGRGYLYFTKEDKANPIFFPKAPSSFFQNDSLLSRRPVDIEDSDGYDSESGSDGDQDGDDDDDDIPEADVEDSLGDAPPADVYTAGNPFGLEPVLKTHVSAVDPEQFVPFSTLMRTTLPTVYGLNGISRFSCWTRSVKNVLSYSVEAETEVYRPVVSLQVRTEQNTKMSIDLPPGLFFLFGDTGVGKSTMMTTVLPSLFSPKLKWVQDPLITDPARLTGYVGFGEPNVFARDGSDWAGFLLDFSAALTRFPIVFVDSMKVVQVSGEGAASEGGFMRWAYPVFQSWARLAQLNGLVIFVTLHSYGSSEERRDRMLNELAAISGGYCDVQSYTARSGYTVASTVRVPVSIGTRDKRTYLVPAGSDTIAAISKGIYATFEARKARAAALGRRVGSVSDPE